MQSVERRLVRNVCHRVRGLESRQAVSPTGAKSGVCCHSREAKWKELDKRPGVEQSLNDHASPESLFRGRQRETFGVWDNEGSKVLSDGTN
jgi:hypothetical protein